MIEDSASIHCLGSKISENISRLLKAGYSFVEKKLRADMKKKAVCTIKCKGCKWYNQVQGVQERIGAEKKLRAHIKISTGSLQAPRSLYKHPVHVTMLQELQCYKSYNVTMLQCYEHYVNVTMLASNQRLHLDQSRSVSPLI